ncbi:hypothetical protein ACJJTC_009186 [Scirpophaga incertulas]
MNTDDELDILIYFEANPSSVREGKRKPGGQYLRYRDVLKRHLTAISMSSESWEELATKRTEWRTAVKTGLENFESTRLEELDSKRQHRKTRPKPSYDYTYDSNGNLYCASCNRTFKSKFGFASHARAHARRDQGNVLVDSGSPSTDTSGRTSSSSSSISTIITLYV